MAHKKNDLSYSEGGSNGIDRQSSMSSSAANPFGVNLKKLSFRSQVMPSTSPRSPSKNSFKMEPTRPKRPKTAKQRTSSKQINMNENAKNSNHTYEKSDIIPPPAFSHNNSNNKNNDDVKNDNTSSTNPESRAKKRKLRRQLSLAKMQMSVLKARLGLEQMKTPRVISEDGIDDIVDDDLSSIGDASIQNGHNNNNNNNHSNSHSRSVSVSTENLFATIESMGSFENDIKDAIQKVDDLMTQVNDQKSNDQKSNDQNELELVKENKKLKSEIDEIKKKLQSVQAENSKLKSQLKSNNNKNDNNNNKRTSIKDFKPDPLEKYSKMKDLGMSIDNVVSKMTKAGVDSKEIEKWKQKHSSQSADQLLASKVNAKELQYAKYDKMKKLGMPDNTIRNKMTMDGFKKEEIDRYLNGGKSAENNGGGDDEFTKQMAKYKKLQKMLPENALRNKMKLDGISQSDQDKFFNPDANAKKDNNDGGNDEFTKKMAKYKKLQKMLPEVAIRNKMKLDGISAEDQDKFFNPESSSTKNKKKKDSAKNDERLKKYNRMIKMGMPMHAIINKMRLDGIEQSLIHKFEHQDDEEEEDDDDDDDPNKANAINLNIPALAKYQRMKKMGMPLHAIANKMRLDGIDNNLVEAFENPEAVKKKKKTWFRWYIS